MDLHDGQRVEPQFTSGVFKTSWRETRIWFLWMAEDWGYGHICIGFPSRCNLSVEFHKQSGGSASRTRFISSRIQLSREFASAESGCRIVALRKRIKPVSLTACCFKIHIKSLYIIMVLWLISHRTLWADICYKYKNHKTSRAFSFDSLYVRLQKINKTKQTGLMEQRALL